MKKRKKRVTPGRKNIISLFCSTPYPISAEILTAKTKLNKTSVYREIDFLLKEGFIKEVDFGDRIKRYELNDLGHHHHLVCLNCKNIQDITLEENLEEEERRIEKLKKFHVAKHNLEFFGLCNKCFHL